MMNAVFAIIWFIALFASIVLIFNFIGMHGMVTFFPEGRRWWMFPLQILSLTLFSALVLINPF